MQQSFLNRVARSLKIGTVVAAGIMLAGCQSKNPIDYLPEASGGYMGMNMVEMRESAGLKRLSEQMEKMQPGAANLQSEKAQKVYMAFDSPANAGTAPAMYGVALGASGFADEVVKLYTDGGAPEGETAGMTTYTSGPVTIAPVGDNGILVFQDSATLDRMIAVSKKKQPGAIASTEFNFVSGALNEHAFVIAGKAQPLVALAGPMLTAFEQANPEAAAAIRQVTMLSMTFDWDANPVAVVKLHVPDKAKSDVLAETINMYLGMAKMNPMVSMNPNFSKILGPLTATSAEDGVTLKIDVPAEVADQLFTQMESMGQMPGAGQMPGGLSPQQQQQMMQMQQMQMQQMQTQPMQTQPMQSGQTPGAANQGAIPQQTPGAPTE